MRYVKKGAGPDFFEACRELSQCKKELHDYLISEQSGLCIYCERQIAHDVSHVEHIFPKSQVAYAHLTFSYANLVASCNGSSCFMGGQDIYKPEDVNSCGYKKENNIDEYFFLNPVTWTEIGNYFIYNKTSCAILSAEKDPAKASYTLDLLNLDSTRLRNKCSNARKALMQVTAKFQANERKQKIRSLLAGNPAFISFLRYHFSSILAPHP